ncbi:hypothetical protein BSKO_09755 [Bryopsis sp. KO-2023]|nr:hypothetical protein BSKO_09755 [Bryopsis sp. KO-2023]
MASNGPIECNQDFQCTLMSEKTPPVLRSISESGLIKLHHGLKIFNLPYLNRSHQGTSKNCSKRKHESKKRLWIVFSSWGKTTWPFHGCNFPYHFAGSRRGVNHDEKHLSYQKLDFGSRQNLKITIHGVFGNDAMETGISAEVLRHCTLTNRPKQKDTDLMWINPAFQNRAPENLGD